MRAFLLTFSLPCLLLVLAILVEKVIGWLPCTLCAEIRFYLLGIMLLSPLALLSARWVRLLVLVLVQLLYLAAAITNLHLVLLEYGILDAYSCSPFPFYSSWFASPFDVPEFLQSQAMCGQDINTILGLNFSLYTLLGILICQAVFGIGFWRQMRR